MQLQMMVTAQRNGKLVADLSPKGLGLGKFDVMGIAWRASTDDAWLRGNVCKRIEPGRHVRRHSRRGHSEAAASPQSCWHFCAGHLQDRERQPGRPRGRAAIRVRRLSHKAVLREVADRAARESISGAYIGSP
jgi:hypothetical protein